jgi:hypothetical protein
MPEHPWRFTPGDIAYVRPATVEHRVKVITPILRATETGIKFPCWLAVDDNGKTVEVMQIELSSKLVSAEARRATLLKGAK